MPASVTATIPIGFEAAGVSVSPDGTRLYAVSTGGDTDHAKGTVSVIDTATNAVTTTIPGLRFPSAAAIGPNGARLYVANTSGNSVSVINTVTNAVTTTIPVGNEPLG